MFEQDSLVAVVRTDVINPPQLVVETLVSCLSDGKGSDREVLGAVLPEIARRWLGGGFHLKMGRKAIEKLFNQPNSISRIEDGNINFKMDSDLVSLEAKQMLFVMVDAFVNRGFCQNTDDVMKHLNAWRLASGRFQVEIPAGVDGHVEFGRAVKEQLFYLLGQYYTAVALEVIGNIGSNMEAGDFGHNVWLEMVERTNRLATRDRLYGAFVAGAIHESERARVFLEELVSSG